MDDSLRLHQQAIQAAISSNWDEALKLNQQIIDSEPDNTDALNRLGRAYFELGKLAESKKNYQKVLKLDPYNQIAYKCLKRVETFKQKSFSKNHQNNVTQIVTDLFIEEPGRTKVVNLLKVAEPQKLSQLSPGSVVYLVAKNRAVLVTDSQEEYLGALPDDVSHQLIRLIKGGNKYQAILKTIKTNGLSILIREVFRSAKFKNQPSFLDNLNSLVTYSSDHIIMDNDEYPEETTDLSEEEN